MGIMIEQSLAPDDDVRALIQELEQDLSPNYAPHQRHGLSLDAIFQPHIHFFLARSAGCALGCGGIALYRDFAEVKRMYVRGPARGQGIADALMNRLEETPAPRGAPCCGWKPATSSWRPSASIRGAAFAIAPISSPILLCRRTASPPASSWKKRFKPPAPCAARACRTA